MKEYVKIDESVLKILRDAFSVGASDEQACFLANISPQTLYNYQKEHPDYVEYKATLKEMPKFKAKKVVVNAIEEGDKQQANWYLERRDKDFKPKSDITSADLPIPLAYELLSNNSNKKDNETKQED
jgi:hypothetical protein